MTEAEWLAATDPAPMLAFLQGKASDRKLRLFGAGCCRRVWDKMCDPKVQNALQIVERVVDGSDIPAKLRRASADLQDIAARQERTFGEFGYVYDDGWFPVRAVNCLFDATGLAPLAHFEGVHHYLLRFVQERPFSEYRDQDVRREQAAVCDLLRDIFGNPFRPIAFDPAWHTSTAVALAAGIYEDRAFDRLPILADALQDAGCDHPDILDHCRGDGPHVRGCWVVDLILGKS